MFHVILLVSLVAGVFGQGTFTGLCPVGLKNVDLPQIAGVWYEKQRIPITNANFDCGHWEFRSSSATAGNVTYTRRNSGNEVAETGQISKIVSENLAFYEITNLFGETRYYYVVESDQNSLVLYSCTSGVNATTLSTFWAWKLSKNQTEWVSTTVIETAVNNTSGLQGATWADVNQNQCSGTITFVASPLLAVVAFFFATKESLFSR